MNGASLEAQRYATNIKSGTGSAQTFATNQRAIQTSMNGTSIASKAAAVGINIFKAALNTLIFFAVIEGIQLLVKGIDSLILTAEEAEEKAESLRNSMQSFFDEVQSGQQTISSISDRFSELSKHVTETGENIDLTKDEYSEYLDICNQVKSIMPELVTGYTNEGNAIITLKDNVDSLTESYKENIRAKAAEFVTNGDDDGNTIQSFFDDYKIFTEGEGGLFAPSAGGLWNNKSTDYEDYYGYDKVHEWLSEVADLSLKDLQNLQKGTTQATYLYALLKENGYELANITEDNYEAVHDVLDTRLTSLEGEMATRVSNVKMSLQQMLYADRDYWDIDNKEALSAIDSLFSSVDAEFIKQNNLLGQTALQSFESNVTRLFEDKNTQQSMIDIYAPQGTEESIEDYSKRVNNAIKNVQDYAKENKIDISLDFGDVTDDVETLQKQYDDAISKFTDNETQSLEDLKTKYQEAIDKRKELYSGSNYVGNVDINNRPVVINDDGSYSTTSTSFQEKWVGDEENGSYKIIHFTPILPDGTILEGEALNEYIDKILNSSDSLEADSPKNGGYGIVYKVDTEVNGKKITDDNLDEAFGVADAWDVEMHDLQDKMYRDEAEIKSAIEKFGNGSEVDLEKFFKDNSINTTEEIDYWNNVTEGAKSAEEAVKMYNDAKKNGNKTDILSFSDALEKLKNSTDDATKGLADNLTELAEKGQLTVEAFSKADTTDFFKNAGISAEEAVKKINELVSASTQLQSMSAQISKMSDMLADKKNGTVASASDLAGFDVEVRGLNSWEEFEKVMGSAESTMEQCQKAANDLATEWVNSNNFLANLDDTNKDYYITQLKNMGIENARSVVTKSLAEKHYALELSEKAVSAATSDMASHTNNATNEFLKEHDMSQNVKIAIMEVVAAQTTFNNQSLDVSGKISSLESLIGAYLSVAEAAKFAAGIDGLQKRYELGIGEFAGLDSDAATERMNKMIQQNYSSFLERNRTELKVDVSTSGSNGNNPPSTGGSGGSGSSKEDTKQEVDWISRLLDVLQKKIDTTKAKFDNLFSFTAKKNNLQSQIDDTTKLLNAQEKAVKRYTSKAEKFYNKNKSTFAKSGITIETLQSGNYDIKKYSSDVVDLISQYQGYYDKALDAEQSVQETTTIIRQLQEQQYQLYVDKYNAQKELYESEIASATTAKTKNKYIQKEISAIRNSYKHQIDIAKLNNDITEAKRLEFEREQEILELKKQKLENLKSEYDSQAELNSLQAETVSTTKEKNKYLNNQINLLNKSYDKQVEITLLDGNITEAQKLRLNQEKEILEIMKQQLENIQNQHQSVVDINNARMSNLNNSSQKKLYNENAKEYEKAAKEERNKINSSEYKKELTSATNTKLKSLALGKAQEGINKKYSSKSSKFQNIKNALKNSSLLSNEANKKIIECVSNGIRIDDKYLKKLKKSKNPEDIALYNKLKAYNDSWDNLYNSTIDDKKLKKQAKQEANKELLNNYTQKIQNNITNAREERSKALQVDINETENRLNTIESKFANANSLKEKSALSELKFTETAKKYNQEILKAKNDIVDAEERKLKVQELQNQKAEALRNILKEQLQLIQQQYDDKTELNNSKIQNSDNKTQKKLYNKNATNYENANKELSKYIGSSEYKKDVKDATNDKLESMALDSVPKLMKKTYGKDTEKYKNINNALKNANLSNEEISAIRDCIKNGVEIPKNYLDEIKKSNPKLYNKLKTYNDAYKTKLDAFKKKNKSKVKSDIVSQIQSNVEQQTQDNIAKAREERSKALQVDIDQAENRISNLESRYANATSIGEKNAISEAKYNEVAYQYDKEIAKAINDIVDAQERELKVQELNNQKAKELRQIKKQEFDDIQAAYENEQSLIEHNSNLLETSVSLLEAKGKKAGENYYSAEISYQNQLIASKTQQLNDMKSKLNEITPNTAEWWDAYKAINSIEGSIAEAGVKVQELQNTINNIGFEKFKLYTTYVSNAIDELEFMQELLDEEDFFAKDDASITETGKADLSLIVSKRQANQELATGALAEIKALDEMYANDKANTKYIEQRAELVKQYEGYVKNVQSAWKEVGDLIEKQMDKIQESLSTIISEYENALDSAKDLRDFQKTVNEKSNNINDITKQIIALGGDTSQENQARLQKLQKDLSDANEDLSDTYYDKWLSDQKQILSNLETGIEEYFNELDLNGLISKVIVDTEANGMKLDDIVKGIQGTEGFVPQYFNKDSKDTIFGDTKTVIDETKGLVNDIYKVLDEEAKAKKESEEKAKIEEASRQAKLAEEKAKIEQQAKAKQEAEQQAKQAKLAEQQTNSNPVVNPTIMAKPTSPMVNIPILKLSNQLKSYMSKFPKEGIIDNENEAQYSDLISLIKQGLTKLGYTGLNSSGSIGDGTRNAVKQYYKDTGLSPNATGKKIGKGFVNKLISDLNAKGYKSGGKNISDTFFRSQEEGLGSEAIILPDGSMLTQVGTSGSTIFNKEQTDALWQLSKNYMGINTNSLANMIPANLNNNVRSGDVVIDIGDIYMDNVNNPIEFANQLVDTINNNTRVQKVLDTRTLTKLTGGNSLSSRRY